MGNNNSRKVSLRVHESFFNNIFEPERRKLSMKLGRELSQPAFTNYLAINGARIQFPKMKKMPKQKINNQFSPKRIDLGFGGKFNLL